MTEERTIPTSGEPFKPDWDERVWMFKERQRKAERAAARAASDDGPAGRRVGVVAAEVGAGGLYLRRRPAFVANGTVTVQLAEVDATVTIETVDEPRPHVRVKSIEVAAIDDGPGLSARLLQRARLGEAVRLAVAELTFHENPDDQVDAAMSSTPSARKGSTPGVEIVEAARLWHEAMDTGVPTGEHVRRGLSKLPGGGHFTAETARRRISQARAAHLIPPSDNGTRPRRPSTE